MPPMLVGECNVFAQLTNVSGFCNAVYHHGDYSWGYGVTQCFMPLQKPVAETDIMCILKSMFEFERILNIVEHKIFQAIHTWCIPIFYNNLYHKNISELIERIVD